MATVPSTIVVFTEDKVNFPLRWALIVMKQLFQYGVNKISMKEDKIFIELSYTPNAQRLKSKFGNLPVRYMRTKIENPEEFKVLEKVVMRYRYNLLDEDADSLRKLEASTASKRKLISPPGPALPTITLEEVENLIEEEEEEEEQEGNIEYCTPSTSKRQKMNEKK